MIKVTQAYIYKIVYNFAFLSAIGLNLYHDIVFMVWLCDLDLLLILNIHVIILSVSRVLRGKSTFAVMTLALQSS